MDLTAQKCVPCEGDAKPMKRSDFEGHLDKVPQWGVVDDTLITRTFKFKDFKEAVKFVNNVAELAESEGHHPDIALHNWNKVTITLFTHAIKGLSLNDFIVASKIDTLK
ncbi:MAG: 4a-hydroxytetrahydrobiopterin dehydratase [Patescibacteria group bacterium]